MEKKEEKKERRQGYFARLKRKKQAKQNSEGTLGDPYRDSSQKKNNADLNESKNGQEKAVETVENVTASASSPSTCVANKENASDEEKKKRSSQRKQNRRTGHKRYSAGQGLNLGHTFQSSDRQFGDTLHTKNESRPIQINNAVSQRVNSRNKDNEKKEKKMVHPRPSGTIEYTVQSQDTLSCIALKFNITPNKLAEINKLFSHTIVPGQTLYVPDSDYQYRSVNTHLLNPASPLSSDADYDKLSDAELPSDASKRFDCLLSSTSEDEEPVVVKFLKMKCRYFTDGKGVVGGVMLVTPNNVMFDPHKSDPLVIENGCEEYGLICPMEEIVSIALYNDISHMKLKDVLPSPQDWEDLSSEKDLNPFSKFKAMSKEKRQTNGRDGSISAEAKTTELPKNINGGLFDTSIATDSQTGRPSHTDRLADQQTVRLSCISGTTSTTTEILEKTSSKTEETTTVEDLTLLLPSHHQEGALVSMVKVEGEAPELTLEDKKQEEGEGSVSVESHKVEVMETAKAEQCTTEHLTVADNGSRQDINVPEALMHPSEETNDSVVTAVELCQDGGPEVEPSSKDLLKTEFQGGAVDSSLNGDNQAGTVNELASIKNDELKNRCSEEDPNSTQSIEAAPVSQEVPEHTLNGEGSPQSSSPEELQDKEVDSEAEIKLWLLQKIKGPIEDMMPSKEEKSKNPPMFLCIKVGKPMRKSFATQSISMMHQYARQGNQTEYWFAVPQERVEHLYAFLIHWSPEVYGKEAKDQGFVVVEKDELDMIDNFFSEPTTKSWEIITVEEARRRKSICSFYGEDHDELLLPILMDVSGLLANHHIEKLVRHLPARTQGYAWQLMYSTSMHGTSLKTLYRNLACLDSPVLLVVKDMDDQVFGALASHPFKISDHYYGTGETFLFTFNPEFQIFKWSGDNSYFIKGDLDFLELGGGGSGYFGLWIDSDLYYGRSSPCSTFNNEILSSKEDFTVQELEVWTFV